MNDPSSIWSVQFSPDGQFLATGAFDGNVRVCTLKMRILYQSHFTLLDMGYRHKTNAGHV